MKSLLFVFLLFFQIPSIHAVSADIVEDLAIHLRNGSSKDIAKNFSSSVELLIIDQEDVYSKAQAEQILKEFFLKNAPVKVSIIHRISSNPNYRYGIYSFQSKGLKYRVNVTLMHQKASNTFLITELRIEKD